MSEDPLVILDGAHNPNGIEALKNAVRRYNDRDSAVLVLGMLADKDSRGSIKLLDGMFDAVYTVAVSNPRTLSAEALAEECEGHFGEVIPCKSAREAVEKALTRAKERNSLMVIAGSLYLAGEIRPMLLT
jgi:dihydrofolate synthase/folylpolyglutamate synthase